jgi:hypothetical protein
MEKLKKSAIVCSIVAASVFAFACNNDANRDNNDSRNSPDHVEEHSQEEITPQVSEGSDSTRLQVDTVSSAESANDRADSI